MLGALFGDIVGSPYEFDEYNIKTTDFPLLCERSDFTDDSVMTVAVAEALMDTYGMEDDLIKGALVVRMQEYGREYPNRGYGGRFQGWIQEDHPEPYNSWGNGSAMRVSPAGWLYRTLPETLHAAELTAVVTHNHPEGIKGAQATAAAIFLARAHVDKDDIRAYLARTFDYDLYRTLKEIRPTYHMDESCQGSVPEAIIAFLEGQGYVDVLRKAVSIGGDSDTIACIAGGIAEAYYGMPEQIEKMAMDALPIAFRSVVRKFRRFYMENAGPPLPGWENDVYDNPEEVLSGLTALEFAISDFHVQGAGGGVQAVTRPESAHDANPNAVLDELGILMKRGAQVLTAVNHAPKFRGTGAVDETVQYICIQDEAGNQYLPVFTSKRELKNANLSVIFSPLEDCLRSACGAKGVTGVILNPFGQNFVLDQSALQFVLARFEATQDE